MLEADELPMSWDVFISHASEDKQAVALPLAKLLGDRGVRVWIDAQELVLGDSLRTKIDEGLARSQWGVVILSPSFFGKPWAGAEVDALVSRELGGQRVLLPVWHEVSAADVARSSPLLAARLGVSTDRGLDQVCEAIVSAMGRAGSAAPAAPAASAAAGVVAAGEATFEDAWFGAFSGSGARPHTDVPDLRDRQLGPYRIRQPVGRGGSGVVFRALHVHLGRLVALKVLYSLDDQTSAVTRAAERGLRGLASVRHPGILSPLDFGYARSGGRVSLFIASDLVDGQDIERWSRQLGGPDALERRLAAAVQLSQAVQAAHDCRFIGDLGFEETGVLHGDIKPANVLVDRRDERPLLLDFMIPDIQRLLDGPRSGMWRKGADGGYGYRPPTTAAFGTPGFMAPEQELDGIVSPASDIYSLGVTLGRVLWPLADDGGGGMSYDQVLATSGQRGSREHALARLVAAMTSPNPGDRPRRMQDVLAALAAA